MTDLLYEVKQQGGVYTNCIKQNWSIAALCAQDSKYLYTIASRVLWQRFKSRIKHFPPKNRKFDSTDELSIKLHILCSSEMTRSLSSSFLVNGNIC